MFIPPDWIGGFITSISAATISGILSWFGGNKHGVRKGEARFLEAVQEAASLVIERLEAEIDRLRGLHVDCEEKCLSLQHQINELRGK